MTDLDEMAKEQLKEESFDEIVNKYNLKKFKVGNEELYCNIDMKNPRPFVPESMRKSVFDNLHSLSHPGIGGTEKLIKERYFWPEMSKRIKEECKSCFACQKSKIDRHVKTIPHFELPAAGKELLAKQGVLLRKNF